MIKWSRINGVTKRCFIFVGKGSKQMLSGTGNLVILRHLEVKKLCSHNILKVTPLLIQPQKKLRLNPRGLWAQSWLCAQRSIPVFLGTHGGTRDRMQINCKQGKFPTHYHSGFPIDLFNHRKCSNFFMKTKKYIKSTWELGNNI